jgi:hypothetical protein
VPVRRYPAHFPHGRGGQTLARDVLRDPIAKVRSVVSGEIQVESAQYRALLVYEQVIRAIPRVLVGKQGIVLLGEPIEEFVTAIGDERPEVVTVGELESQNGRFVIGAEQLQFGHCATLLVRHA